MSINGKLLALTVLDSTRTATITDTISTGDQGAYTVKITWSNVVSISGFPLLRFVLPDGSIVDKDPDDGVILDRNTVTYLLDKALYAAPGLLKMYVRFIDGVTKFTPLLVRFAGVRAVSG